MLLHPIKRQPFLQWHGELIGEAPPVVVSHLVLKSMKDLKLNTGQAALKNRTWQGVSREPLDFPSWPQEGLVHFHPWPLKFPNLGDVVVYLVEHVSEIILWIHPGSYCIAEEYKILFQRRDQSASTFRTAHPNVRQWLNLTCMTPPGFTVIIVQIPLNAESFSSLSLIFRSEEHLTTGTTAFNIHQLQATGVAWH